MDGTGLGTDVLLVLFELLVPWFCCSDCICSAAEYNVDSFLEHTWARTLARVWDMTIWSTYWKKKNGARKIKIWPEMQTLFFLFLCASPFQAQLNVDFFVSLFLNTSFYPCPPPPPTNWNCFNWSKIEPFCNGETLRKLAHRCVYKNAMAVQVCVQKCIYTELLEQNRNQTVPLVKEE